MSQPKSKIGFVPLAGDSWWQAGLCSGKDPRYDNFLHKLQDSASRVRRLLEERFLVVSPPDLVHTVSQGAAVARQLNAEDVDSVVLCPVVWTNDGPLISFLQEARKKPTVLFAYQTFARLPDYFSIDEWLLDSGPVSVQQSAGILKRFGWTFTSVLGNADESQARQELFSYLAAAAVMKRIKGIRIGMLPSPCKLVASTWCDDFFLLEKLGIGVEYISVSEYRRWIERVSTLRAADYAKSLLDSYDCEDVGYDVLVEASRQTIAMVDLVKEMDLSGVALDDFNSEIYQQLGFRPHLYHPQLGEMKCTVGFEADVANVASTVILGMLATSVGMINELFTLDVPNNTILMGHPGFGEISFADPKTIMVTPDLEFAADQTRGVWLSYRVREGKASFLNFTPVDGKLTAAFFTGQSLGGPRLMEGYSHMLVAPDCAVRTMFKRIVEKGLIQHWGTVLSDVRQEIWDFCSLAGIDLVDLCIGGTDRPSDGT